ncbi:flagellar export chaperone FliS [Thermomonas sp. XSG]|jgi:flagellar protein FliS|uniref:flagellar export chaperone FliS n=1 Tax=Thermomonas sp. XSG TaxID=2771436 RepID=UPI00086DE792|nr:flagellar export chaperone FliS [Thermomonas sp. XSG]ODU41422.1 MAG: flagellar export chaperone FliS [Xanthomonadaceae bacterium SCN 69-48]QNU16356.1 flagellar export chaperone FliS [Thermomonas sp. XSG]
MNARTSAQHYRQTAVSSAVLDASPHRLVSLMLAGVRERLRLASACIEIGDLPRKGQAISEASLIIGQLDGSLDHAAGGEIADGLAALYDYSQRRLTEANVNNDVAVVQEVDGLIADIEAAWQQIDPERGR